MSVTVYLQVLCATFLWGSAFPFLKIGLAYVPPLHLAAMRFSLAGIMLLVGSLLLGREKSAVIRADATRVNWPRVLLISSLSTVIFYALFFLGIARTSASSGAVLDGSSPIISSLLAHFILKNDKLTPRKLLACVACFGGILLVTFGGHAHQADKAASVMGCLLIFAGLIVSSCGTLLVVTYRGSLGLLRLTGTQMFIGGMALFVISTLAGEKCQWSNLANMRFLLVWGYLSALSAIAFTIWYSLVRRYKMTSMAPLQSLIGIWGTLLSIVLVHDPVTLELFLGLGLVVAGVVLIHSDGSGHERDEEQQLPLEEVSPEEKTSASCCASRE